MIKETKVTCKKCKANFILTTDSSILDEVLDAGHYICFTCEDKMEEKKMTTNINLDEEQLEEIVKKLSKLSKKQKKRKLQPLNLQNMNPQK